MEKVMKEAISSDEKVARYREYPNYNFSLLTGLPYSLKAEKKESQAMNFGSLVDCLLTTPEMYDSIFEVVAIGPPNTAEALKYCQVYIETEDREQAQIQSGFKSQVSDKKFEEQFKPYCDAMIRAKGKIAITFEQKVLADKIVDTLKTHSFTNQYFEETDSVDIYYQEPVLDVKVGDYKYKALFDLIKVDHSNKRIIPVDIKVSEKNESFYKTVERFRYDIQAAIYSYAANKFREDKKLNSYAIESFRFIKVSQASPTTPRIYVASKSMITLGTSGGVLFSGKLVKGFIELTEDYNWYEENGLYDYPRELYNSNGEEVIEFEIRE